jgi:hypothetical protein
MERSITLQKITPFLWCDTQAEEAANFYVSLLEDSEVTSVQRLDGTPSHADEDARTRESLRRSQASRGHERSGGATVPQTPARKKGLQHHANHRTSCRRGGGLT